MRRLPALLLCLAPACAKEGGRVPPPDLAPPAAEAGPPVQAWVGEPVILEGSGEGLLFTWTFGDGESLSLTEPRASHTWQAPGHYTATLEALGEDRTRTQDQVAVHVAYRPLDPAPRAASTLVATDRTVIAVMPDHDRLALVDRATGDLSWLTTCGRPRSIALGTERIAVACALDEVRLYRASDLQLTDTIPLPWGSRPFGVVLSPQDEVYLTLQGTGELVTVDPSGITSRTPLGPDLRGLAWTPASVLVSRHRSPDEAGWLWSVGQVPTAWTLAPDPGPDSDTDSRGVPTYLERIAVRPDGRVAVVGGLKANLGRGLVTDGLPLTHETTVRAVLRSVALDPGEGPVGSELAEPHFDDRDRVAAMAFSPRGDWLWVAHHGARMVDLVDPYTMDRVGGFFVDGHGPDGLWVSEDGTELWVLASLSRELLVYDVADPTGPALLLARHPLATGLAEPLGDQALRGKQIFYGAWDPRMTASGYISCGSCHLDGTHDGRTWDFTDRGEGLRNTISLAGGAGLDHGLLHWTANFDEIQDFEEALRGPMAGTGFLSEADWAATAEALGPPKAGLSEELDALAAYVATLDTVPRSPYRLEDGSLGTAAQQGELLFSSPATGCADCHPPPTYTDSGLDADGQPILHDVGTLGPDSGSRQGEPLTGLDTPSLRGLHATAPYLHDGRHPTLRDLLEDNPGDRHGTTSHLGPTELDQLEAFLLSLE